MKLTIIPGPAFWAAVAVRTKMPVPITAPMPSNVNWKAPSDRLSDFFSAVARIESNGLMRPTPLVRGAAVATMSPLIVPVRGATLTAEAVRAIPVRRDYAAQPEPELTCKHRPQRTTTENVQM